MGAGPGDPDLITVKAARALQKADVVLCDRLVSEAILHRYVKPNAQVISVGKACSKPGSTPQKNINELLVQYAQENDLVVRLKGGDVSFFSNVLDELTELKKHNISYEIIPGITAASGAAAYAGFPLTARGYSNAVRFLTYYKNDVVSDAYWKDLATTGDTLVFYMSMSVVHTVVDNLLALGISKDVHVAVIEQATTPMQKVHECNIYEYMSTLRGLSFKSPSLVIIGRVVALHEQFQWLQNAAGDDLYFRELDALQQNYYQPDKSLLHVV